MTEDNAEKKAGYLNLFSKKDLLKAKRFQKDRDILAAVLDEGRVYTIKEAEAKVETYKKAKVK